LLKRKFLEDKDFGLSTDRGLVVYFNDNDVL